MFIISITEHFGKPGGPSLSFSSFARLRLSYQLAHSCGWWRFFARSSSQNSSLFEVSVIVAIVSGIIPCMYVCTYVHVPRDSITRIGRYSFLFSALSTDALFFLLFSPLRLFLVGCLKEVIVNRLTIAGWLIASF